MDVSKEVSKILSSEMFQKIVNCDTIEIAQLTAVIALLIKANIDFDVVFTSGTRRQDPQAILTIFITPTVDIDFTFVFGKGQPTT